MHSGSNPEPLCYEIAVLKTEPQSSVLHLPTFEIEHSQVHSESQKYRISTSRKTLHKHVACVIMKLKPWVFMPN